MLLAFLTVLAVIIAGWAIVRLLIADDDAVIIEVVPVAEIAAIQVQVAGAVERPGVHSLPEGSTVADALQAAGSPLVDPATVDFRLDDALVDGQYIYVREPGDAGVPLVPQLVNINTASAEELETLPGIGPVLAARIIEYRTTQGRIQELEQLVAVSGISARMVEELLPYVTLEAP